MKPAKRSLTDTAYRILKNEIVSLELQPGEPLAEGAISQRLGVSRTPVREALIRLRNEGLVEMKNSRLYVSRLQAEDIYEIYVLREALEGIAAGIVARDISKEKLEELRKIHKKLQRVLEKEDHKRFFQVDNQFHRVLVEQAGIRRITQLLEEQSNLIARVRYTTILVPNRMVNTITEHEAILTALATGASEQAETAARQHIKEVREGVCLLLDTIGMGVV